MLSLNTWALVVGRGFGRKILLLDNYVVDSSGTLEKWGECQMFDIPEMIKPNPQLH